MGAIMILVFSIVGTTSFFSVNLPKTVEVFGAIIGIVAGFGMVVGFVENKK